RRQVLPLEGDPGLRLRPALAADPLYGVSGDVPRPQRARGHREPEIVGDDVGGALPRILGLRAPRAACYQVKRLVKNSFTRCVNDGSFAGRSAGGALSGVAVAAASRAALAWPIALGGSMPAASAAGGWPLPVRAGAGGTARGRLRAR